MSERQSEIAVVTGGSSGIGFTVTEELLEQGYRVAFFGQSPESTVAANERLRDRFDADRFIGRTADLRQPHEIKAFFDEVRSLWAAPTTLVCNAGISPKSPNGRVEIGDIDPVEWNEVLQVNLTGAFTCLQCILDDMRDAQYGRVVLIGSIAGRAMPRIAGAAYVASKSALSGLARSLVAEYSQYGITTNVVAPGRIMTEMTGDPDSEANRAALGRIPIARLGAPADIARVVAFLADRQSSFINGAIIDVNGGEFCPV